MLSQSNDLNKWTIKERMGPARIRTKDGILCECGITLKTLLDPCDCLKKSDHEVGEKDV